MRSRRTASSRSTSGLSFACVGVVQWRERRMPLDGVRAGHPAYGRSHKSIARPLECLSKLRLEGLPADERAAQPEEGEMDVHAPLVAHGKPKEAIEPGQRALRHPAVAAELEAARRSDHISFQWAGVPARVDADAL